MPRRNRGSPNEPPEYEPDPELLGEFEPTDPLPKDEPEYPLDVCEEPVWLKLERPFEAAEFI